MALVPATSKGGQLFMVLARFVRVQFVAWCMMQVRTCMMHDQALRYEFLFHLCDV